MMKDPREEFNNHVSINRIIDPAKRIRELEFANEKLIPAKSANKDPDIFKKLAAPFDKNQLEWRIQNSGVYKKDGSIWAIIVPYVNARSIMDRLDSVVFPEYWQDHYEVSDKGVLCTISLKLNEDWISKQDGAEASAIESFKGGISNAFKRAAVKWGIGRYLYDFETTWAQTMKEEKDQKQDTKGWSRAKLKDTNTIFYWRAPHAGQ